MVGRDEVHRRGYGRLDLGDIITVAIGIARAEGIHALTMRRVADELGCAPMSLYRHVADRRALLLAMLDDVAARIDLPEPLGDPAAEITALMSAAHRVMAADAWVVTVLVVDGLASPLILPLIERLVGALARAGLDGRRAIAAHALLWQFTYGELLTTHHARADAWNRRMVLDSDPQRFPRLHAALAELDPDGGAERYPDNLALVVRSVLEQVGPHH
ncbi:TetR/AcrR family transcriptional regulator [Pseudonocardia humida]|uniref:TetR/AcrR family transcriptional regulator n=1 Tax=Pseudonocardia humida TaxID=2800819 RepID=A0ABT0ZWQ2_9PSEU|nr:TetR/AcrR family transcriptional regulator [Pseudonocardia humida]MCO1655156.1 TetR/AcrR family transcriptional regulator [Pseudonocardia humida]